MKNGSTNVAYQVAEKESQRTLSIVKMRKKTAEPLPDFNFLRTNFEYSHGIKTWVSLKPR